MKINDFRNEDLKYIGTFIAKQYELPVLSVVSMGSFTFERTENSDIDLAIIFSNEVYEKEEQYIVKKTSEIGFNLSKGISISIKLWPAKKKFLINKLPEPEFVLANTPSTIKDLDGWGGLGISTFHAYFYHTQFPLFGDGISSHTIKHIPDWEAFELFLISTRIFAYALHCMVENNNMHHQNIYLAKAILRASYAYHIFKDGSPLNSYKEIYEQTILNFEENFKEILTKAYHIKMNMGEDILTLEEVASFFFSVEDKLKDAPRLKIMGEASFEKYGDRFAFDLMASMEKRVVPWVFRGCLPSENFVYTLYFIRTMPLICNIICKGTFPDCVYHFFMPEIAGQILAVSTQGFKGLTLITSRKDIYNVRWEEINILSLSPFLSKTISTKSWPVVKYNYFHDTSVNTIQVLICLTIHLAFHISSNNQEGNTWFKKAYDYGKINFSRGFELWASWTFELTGGNIKSCQMISDFFLQAGLLELAGKYLLKMIEFKDEFLSSERQNALNTLQYFIDLSENSGDMIPVIEVVNLAINLYPNVTEFNTMWKEVHIHQAIIARSNKDYPKSLEVYNMLIEKFPDDYRIIYNRGNLYSIWNKIDLAIMDFYTSIALKPDYDFPYIKLSHLFLEISQPDKALEVCQKASENNITTPSILLNKGNAYLFMEEYDIAYEIYLKTLDQKMENSTLANILNSMGIIHLRWGEKNRDDEQYKKAVDFFMKAFEKDPNFTSALYNAKVAKENIKTKDKLGGIIHDNSGSNASIYEDKYQITLKNSNLLKIQNQIKSYFDTWNIYLKEAKHLNFNEYDYQRDIFLSDLIGYYIENKSEANSGYDWEEVLQKFYQKFDFDDDISKLIHGLFLYDKGEKEEALNLIKNHPMELTLKYTLFT